MRKIAVDLDGFLTSISVEARSWIPDRLYQIVLFFFKPSPRLKNVFRVQFWKKKEAKIIILSARPEITRKITKKWLKENEIPVDELVLVGTEDIQKEKWNVLKDKDIDSYYGDSLKTITFLTKKGVNAFLN